MIPTVLAFTEKNDWAKLLAHPLQATAVPANITSIVYQKYDTVTSKYIWRITIGVWVTNAWITRMRALVTNTTNHNGTWEIVNIDTTALTMDIATEIPPNVGNGGALGTVAPSGTIPYENVKTASIVRNNNGDILAYGYASSESFYFRIDGERNDTAVQVVEYGGVAGVSVTIRWSVDGVNWVPFPVAISAVAIGAGATMGWLLNQARFNEIWIRIDVTAVANATYYVIMK